MLKKKTLLNNLFFLSVFLFPIDSFPIFPTNNVYRPISVLVLVVYMLVLLLSTSRGSIKKHHLIVVLAAGFFFVQSLLGAFIFDSTAHLPKAFITLCLVVVIAVTTYDFFDRNKDDFPWDKLIRAFKYSFLLSAFVGTIQILTRIDVLPPEMQTFFTGLFSYRTHRRVQMLSGEPAMMFRHLLLFLVIFVGVRRFKNRRSYILATLIFIFLSGSTLGYVTFFIFIVLYIFLFNIKIIFKPIVLTTLFFMLVSMLFLYKNFLDDYTKKKIELVVKVSTNSDYIEGYLKKDGSFFQRAMNPIIAFRSMGYSYGFGTGLDTYRYVYPKYILSDYSYALNHNEVADTVYNRNYITPKSLYAKIGSELGLISLLLFLGFLLKLYLSIKRVKKSTPYRTLMVLLFITAILFIINSDSIIYVNYYFILYFLWFLHQQKNIYPKRIH